MEKERPLIISPDVLRENRVPPRQRLTEDLPVMQASKKSPRVAAARWSFHIGGLVNRERILTYDQFLSLPRTLLHADLHCVTGWSTLGTHWEGVRTRLLKTLVTISPEAAFVLVHGADGNFTNLPIDEFFAEDALFALRYEGTTLTREAGFPLRLVVPRLYLWKSQRWLTRVEFVKEDLPGYWESHGYHNHGDPWKEERFSDQPSPGDEDGVNEGTRTPDLRGHNPAL